MEKENYESQTKTATALTPHLYFVLQPVVQAQQPQQQMMGPTIVIAGDKATGQSGIQIREYGVVTFHSVPDGAEIYLD